MLFSQLSRTIDPGSHWLLGLDDTPTNATGHTSRAPASTTTPLPGRPGQRFLYGHIWVTIAWLACHPPWGASALPCRPCTSAKDVGRLDDDPLQGRLPHQAPDGRRVGHLDWIAQELQGADRPIWLVVDGAYAKRPLLKAARAASRRDRGQPAPPRRRLARRAARRRGGATRSGPTTPVYGRNRISLAKRAGQHQGWQQVECVQYQHTVTKTIKTFLATWKPAGGVIRVVLVQEADGWRAYFCTEPEATVAEVLEAAADRRRWKTRSRTSRKSRGGRAAAALLAGQRGRLPLGLWSLHAWWSGGPGTRSDEAVGRPEGESRGTGATGGHRTRTT